MTIKYWIFWGVIWSSFNPWESKYPFGTVSKNGKRSSCANNKKLNKVQRNSTLLECQYSHGNQKSKSFHFYFQSLLWLMQIYMSNSSKRSLKLTRSGGTDYGYNQKLIKIDLRANSIQLTNRKRPLFDTDRETVNTYPTIRSEYICHDWTGLCWVRNQRTVSLHELSSQACTRSL